MDDTPRGRWKYDEATDTFTEVPRPEPKPAPEPEPDDDDDAHPGNYI